MPGFPLILLGRTENISWGVTAAMTDVSDLYKERIEGDFYEVDGKKLRLETISHKIVVKGQKEPESFDVKLTHRGPVLPSTLIKNAQVLFGSKLPVDEHLGNFSLAWAGHRPGESILDLQTALKQSSNLVEFKERAKKMEEWRSSPLNIVAADREGNIGYALVSASPVRGDYEYPYKGCKVLDGTSSEFDWKRELVPFKELPFVLNPEKGYFVTANNRVVPSKSRIDVGGTMISTARAIRITEMIEGHKKDKKKLSALDMVQMQQDYLDVVARDMVPFITEITMAVIQDPDYGLKEDDTYDIMDLLDKLKTFDGVMSQDSIPATVYSVWHYYFYSGFFNILVGEWPVERRLMLIDNYAFMDYYQNLLTQMAKGEISAQKQKLCKDGFETQYKGPNHCQFNVAYAFLEAKKHLSQFDDWKWASVHVNEYPNQPWSMIPGLKHLWHREVPTGGNGNTPCVSKYGMSRIVENKVFKSTHTANFKSVFEFRDDPKDDVNLLSIDTGMNGNLFGGNYFSMNSDHLDGKLNQVSTDFDTLDTFKLILRVNKVGDT